MIIILVAKMRNDLIESWVHFLNQPSENNNGVPLCPFALKALNEGDVKTNISENLWQDVLKECFNFEQKKTKVSLFVDYEYDEDYPLLDMQCKALNKFFHLAKMDIWLLSYFRRKEIGYNDIFPEGGIVFVQKWSDLNEASIKLESLGYYKNYHKDHFKQHILDRRSGQF